MTTKLQKLFSILLVFLLALASLPSRSAQAASKPADLPAGLSSSDWAQIKALLPAATPDAQQAYLKASNTGADDNFGYAVSLSGDTLVVGAYQEDSNATGVNGDGADNSASNSGAAYVFTRSGTTWSQQAYLKASNTGADDAFGSTVSLSGDTLVVGAPEEDSNAIGVNGNQVNNSASSSGAAYVFTRSGGVWSQQAYLKASNTGTGDRFGYAVSLSGDTLVVGAETESSNATGVNGNQADNSASGSGAAYVFTRSGTIWSQQAYLKASNTGAGDYFGYTVSLSGDTLAVTADREASNATGVNGNQADNSAPYAGAAYVFTRSGTTWSQQAYLKASNTEAYDRFVAVSLSGDTLVVGAYGEDSNATGVNGDETNNLGFDSGAAYVFTRSAGVWSQQAYLKASNTGVSDLFGWAVSLSGDTLVVGAIGEASNATGVNGDQANNTATDSGAAYVFTRSGTIWSQPNYLKASNTGAFDRFGYAMSLSGDTLVVGAYQEASNATGVNGNQADNSASDSGAAYVYNDTPPSVISSVPADPNPTAAASVNFTVTFSESVTGVDTGDFNLTTTGVSGATVSGVSGSGATRTVSVNTGTGNGTLRLDVSDNDTIVDLSGKPLGGVGAGNGDFSGGEVYIVIKVYNLFLPLILR